MKVYNNISCKQINFDGQNTDFYLSDNVYFRDKHIDNIWFYVARAGKTLACPFDGGTLADDTILDQLYITLVKDNKEIVVQNCSIKEFLLDSNKNTQIDTALSFSMSYLSYTGDPSDLANLSILMYVAWEVENRPDEYREAITDNVTFVYDGPAVKVRISDFVDEWIRRSGYTVKKITINGSDCYVSLRETSGRIFEVVPSYRLYDLSKTTGTNFYTDNLVLSDFDVDFKNSWLIPADVSASPYKVTVTIYY